MGELAEEVAGGGVDDADVLILDEGWGVGPADAGWSPASGPTRNY
jgi:hypothetical protein